MSTKKKRFTKQVRVEAKVHLGIARMATDYGVTISKLVSKLCKPHITSYIKNDYGKKYRRGKKVEIRKGQLHIQY